VRLPAACSRMGGNLRVSSLGSGRVWLVLFPGSRIQPTGAVRTAITKECPGSALVFRNWFAAPSELQVRQTRVSTCRLHDAGGRHESGHGSRRRRRTVEYEMRDMRRGMSANHGPRFRASSTITCCGVNGNQRRSQPDPGGLRIARRAPRAANSKWALASCPTFAQAMACVAAKWRRTTIARRFRFCFVGGLI